MDADIAIVGGGIVGLATAHALADRFPDHRILVLEKESEVGQHQSGHNSGVLHSGIYYKPGSLKAINCRAGKEAMERFCEQHELPYEICGKVIVAVEDSEREVLHQILARGRQNGVRCELISANQLAELEPHVQGVEAIHVPEAGIVDFRQVCLKLAELVRERGHRVETSTPVRHIRPRTDGLQIEVHDGAFEVGYVVNCAGLQSDRVVRMSGMKPPAKIVPFRGEYFELKPESRELCRNLIYPVPDPKFPFLGVHFTRMVDGTVECGPNAVLAFAREGYGKLKVNPADLWESLTYAGFLRLSSKYWRVGLGEMWRSLSKGAFVKALQRLIPEVKSQDLTPARAGVRAQAVGRDGKMVDDFLIEAGERMVHVCNAPSPAATSSLNVGQLVADELAKQLR